MAFQYSINDFCYLFGDWLFNPFAPMNRYRIINIAFKITPTNLSLNPQQS